MEATLIIITPAMVSAASFFFRKRIIFIGDEIIFMVFLAFACVLAPVVRTYVHTTRDIRKPISECEVVCFNSALFGAWARRLRSHESSITGHYLPHRIHRDLSRFFSKLPLRGDQLHLDRGDQLH